MAAMTSDTAQVEVLEPGEHGIIAERSTTTSQAKPDTQKEVQKSRDKQVKKSVRGSRDDLGTQNHVSRRFQKSAVEGQIPAHHLQISRVHSDAKHFDGRPVSFGYVIHPRHPVPWAPYWPEAAQFYTFNLPDYTGLGIYNVSSRYPESHGELFKYSLRSFTIQILIAERARPEARLDRLMNLKGWFLHNLNQALSDAEQCASYSIISEVNALALYDMLYEDDGASSTHLHGLQLVLARYGGMAKLVQADYHMSNMVYFTDSIHSYFSKSPRLLKGRMEGTDIMDGIHHLRLALQPTQSKLSSLRLRSHLMMSFGSPAEFIFIELAEIYKLASSAVGLPAGSVAGLTPCFAISTVQQMEARIDALSARPNELCHPIFSDADRHNHRDTYELIRLSALVLIQRFKVALCGTEDMAMKAHLDHAVQALLCHLLNKATCIRSAEARCWALFVGAPFLERVGVLRKYTISLVSNVVQEFQLKHWTDARAFLTDIFFSPPLQLEACAAFWDEVQFDISQQ